MKECSKCENTFTGNTIDPLSKEPFCPSCLETILRDEYFKEISEKNLGALRRRLEDMLRKSPDSLIEVAAFLAAKNKIKWQDLI